VTKPRLVAPPDGWPPPWPLLIEVLAVPGTDGWALVGGLMTQVHAKLAGVSPNRTTNDVDLLVDVLTRRSSVTSVVAGLRTLGFEPQEPGWPRSPFHRSRVVEQPQRFGGTCATNLAAPPVSSDDRSPGAGRRGGAETNHCRR
jgi:hypothetical protein